MKVALLGTALALVLLIAPLMVYPVFLMHAIIMALLASSFNLVFGYTGLLSFGHAAFFGVGAYALGYLGIHYGWPVEVNLLVAMALGALVGLTVAVLAVRRRGIYFAMITLALAEVVHFFAVQWDGTGGENGLQGIPRGELLGFVDLHDSFTLYYVVLAVAVAALLVVHRIINSPFGMVLKSIHNNEQRALSLGYRVNRYLVLVYTLSAALAGLAGGLKALIFQFAALQDLHWHTSGLIVLAVLIGGVGTFVGPIIGGVLLSLLQNYLAGAGEWVTLILGAIFIACVLLFRRGIAGQLISSGVAGRRSRRPAEQVSERETEAAGAKQSNA